MLSQLFKSFGCMRTDGSTEFLRRVDPFKLGVVVDLFMLSQLFKSFGCMRTDGIACVVVIRREYWVV